MKTASKESFEALMKMFRNKEFKQFVENVNKVQTQMEQ